jgi:GAF domain-containing protein
MNDKKRILEIGPYIGAKTDHTEIAFGKGICGQVAVSGKTFVVDDVYAQDNYLACSIQTKAEIVVPLFSNDILIGQLDIDSHEKDPYSEEDVNFLESLCNLIAHKPELYTKYLPE